MKSPHETNRIVGSTPLSQSPIMNEILIQIPISEILGLNLRAVSPYCRPQFGANGWPPLCDGDALVAQVDRAPAF